MRTRYERHRVKRTEQVSLMVMVIVCTVAVVGLVAAVVHILGSAQLGPMVQSLGGATG